MNSDRQAEQEAERLQDEGKFSEGDTIEVGVAGGELAFTRAEVAAAAVSGLLSADRPGCG